MGDRIFVVVDCEADGPAPVLYSMVCFAAVAVEPGLSRTFYGETAPITDRFIPEALAVSGMTRAQHESFDDPALAMARFAEWLDQLGGQPVFVSDNNGFDWQWINYYLHRYVGRNPFGHSSRRIGDLWAGFNRNMSRGSGYKAFRTTTHDHNPLNDALGNAEALLEMSRRGLAGVVRTET